MAKKQVCMIVLMRPPMPASRGDLVGVDHVEPQLLLDDLLLHLARQLVPDLVRPERGVQQERRRRARVLEHVEFLEEVELVARDEVALLIRYAERIGRGPKRRCEIVIGAGLLGVVDEVALRRSCRSPRR